MHLLAFATSGERALFVKQFVNSTVHSSIIWHALGRQPSPHASWRCCAAPQTAYTADSSAAKHVLQRPDEAPILPYSLQREAIILVDSFDALDEMRQHVFFQNPNPRRDPGYEQPLPTQTATTAVLPHESPNGEQNVEAGGTFPRQTFPVVGMDAEWQPSSGFSPVSLLQIATRQKSFLVDLMWFCRPAPKGWAAAGKAFPEMTQREAALDAFLMALLSSEEIVKAGFELAGDMKNLCRSYPHLSCFSRDVESNRGVVGYLDLKVLALRLAPHDPRLTKHMGLAKLTAAVLSKALDKSQQLSNWGKRPLTEAQIAYAGADAHVLTALLDKLLASSGLEGLRVFPEELAGRLDTAEIAQGAWLWHRVSSAPPAKNPPTEQEQWSWQAHEAELPEEEFNPETPRAMLPVRVRQRTPRLDSQAREHGVNLASLRDFLGQHFPKKGRSVIMRVASADARGVIPNAVPKYSRGGGVVCWKDSIMLFVNVDSQGTTSYPNTFPDTGRKLVWFPGPGQTERHPVIRQMLDLPPLHPPTDQENVTQTKISILLFARLRAGGFGAPYMYLGRLGNPQVDWQAGSSGVFEWELQDYEDLNSEAFQDLVRVANAGRCEGDVAA